MSGKRTWIVERGKGICSVAFSATLLSVPLVALGPVHTALGHRDHGSAITVSQAPAPSANSQTVVAPQQGAPGAGYFHSHDHGNGNGNAFGHDQFQGNGNDQGGPPGGDLRHGHGRGLGNQPPSAQQFTPPAPTPAPAPTPNIFSNQGNGGGNGQGNGGGNDQGNGGGNDQGNGGGNDQGNPFPAQGPGDAHGASHANSNSGTPAPSLQGGNGNGNGPCNALCHNGQNPHLSPSTVVNLPSVAVPSTPTPVTIPVAAPAPSVAPTPAPTTSTPSVPAIPSVPSLLPAPKTITPGFSSTSSANPVGLVAGGRPGRGAGAITALSPLVTGAAALTLPGFGGVTRVAGGLGTLAPATSALIAPPAAAGTPGAGRAATGAQPAHRTGGGSHGDGTTILFIPHFINHIPEGVWIALAAALALAAIGTGAALVSRRRANAQADELAAVAAAALTDPLTGVLNRRGFIEAVERELARARRYHHPFVLAYVDVRGLKSVNDTEGHLAGDTVLKSVAALLTDCARADDVVGRLGGDELGLLLVEQTPAAAKVVTQRIAAQVEAKRKSMNLGVPWDLTVGAASFPQDGQTVDELLGTADRRLYQQRGIHIVSSR